MKKLSILRSVYGLFSVLFHSVVTLFDVIIQPFVTLVREAFQPPVGDFEPRKFSVSTILGKLTPFADIPRPRQMLWQMGHRTNLA